MWRKNTKVNVRCGEDHKSECWDVEKYHKSKCWGVEKDHKSKCWGVEKDHNIYRNKLFLIIMH